MSSPSTIGIDFGTTNSVLAVADGDTSARVLPFTFDNHVHDMVRTALAFRRSGRHDPVSEAGPWAIDMFLEAPEDTRFLQSFKSFAASHAFTDTAVFARRFNFAQLLEVFLRKLGQHANVTYPKRLVIGRPVTFAGAAPDEALAHARYTTAFTALGFDEVHFVLEPVAAAFFYAQRLSAPATVLVGDFGGGTSDFSIMRFVPGKAAQALAHAGVGLAGDTFDYRIIDAVVAPQLGKHATYSSWGKDLPIPLHYFTSFSRWNELSMMNRPPVIKALQEFADASPQRRELEAFIALIESGAVYRLYQQIAAAKARLSDAKEASFHFAVDGVTIARTITRADFESWIAEDLHRLDGAVATVLTRAGLEAGGIDRVFLTGGTSHVPAVRALFQKRFGADRVETGGELISIAKGLALIGAREDAASWAVTPRPAT